MIHKILNIAGENGMYCLIRRKIVEETHIDSQEKVAKSGITLSSQKYKTDDYNTGTSSNNITLHLYNPLRFTDFFCIHPKM